MENELERAVVNAFLEKKDKENSSSEETDYDFSEPEISKIPLSPNKIDFSFLDPEINNYSYVSRRDGIEFIRKKPKEKTPKQKAAMHNFAVVAKSIAGKTKDEADIHEKMREMLKDKKSDDVFRSITNSNIVFPETEKEIYKKKREELLQIMKRFCR